MDPTLEPLDDIRRNPTGVNVPPLERLVSVGAGAAAVVLGVRSRSLGGVVLAGAGAALIARGISGRCPLYRARAMKPGIELRRSVVIAAPRHEVYQVIRNFSGLSKLVKRIESVDVHDKHVSQWVAVVGPMHLQWLAEVVDSEPDRYLSWGTIPGGDIEHLGSIELLDGPGRRGTLLNLEMTVYPPGERWFWPFKAPLQAMLGQLLGAELVRLRKAIEGARAGRADTADAVDADAAFADEDFAEVEAEGAPHVTQTPPPPAL